MLSILICRIRSKKKFGKRLALLDPSSVLQYITNEGERSRRLITSTTIQGYINKNLTMNDVINHYSLFVLILQWKMREMGWENGEASLENWETLKKIDLGYICNIPFLFLPQAQLVECVDHKWPPLLLI